MIRIGAPVPQSINWNGVRRTGACRRVGQRDVELGRRFEDVAAVFGIDQYLRRQCGAFGGRRGNEMRVAVLRRNVIAARRARAWPAKCLARERSEAEAGARPAWEVAESRAAMSGASPLPE